MTELKRTSLADDGARQSEVQSLKLDKTKRILREKKLPPTPPNIFQSYVSLTTELLNYIKVKFYFPREKIPKEFVSRRRTLGRFNA